MGFENFPAEILVCFSRHDVGSKTKAVDPNNQYDFSLIFPFSLYSHARRGLNEGKSFSIWTHYNISSISKHWGRRCGDYLWSFGWKIDLLVNQRNCWDLDDIIGDLQGLFNILKGFEAFVAAFASFHSLFVTIFSLSFTTFPSQSSLKAAFPLLQSHSLYELII
jgi:hypothetical protein